MAKVPKRTVKAPPGPGGDRNPNPNPNKGGPGFTGKGRYGHGLGYHGHPHGATTLATGQGYHGHPPTHPHDSAGKGPSTPHHSITQTSTSGRMPPAMKNRGVKPMRPPK